jgi:hypothetical protein
MTIKRTALRVYASEKYAPEDQFPERPRRTDLQNARFRERLETRTETPSWEEGFGQ